MLVGYLQATGAGGPSMGINDFQCARHPVSVLGPAMVGPGKALQNGSSQMAVKCYFEFGF